MKEFKGTKGEWFIDNNQIKSIQKEKRTFEFHDFVANLEFEKGQASDESVYDAKLIAAAPYLLEALIEINKLAQCSDDRFANYSDSINIITEKAIEKALN